MVSEGPIKWMSPESIGSLKYSTKSDVWSYATVIWEIYARKVPFDKESLFDIAIKIRDKGLTPEITEEMKVPKNVIQIMNNCWNFDPANRPEFEAICAYLDEVYPPDGPDLSPQPTNKAEVNAALDIEKKEKKVKRGGVAGEKAVTMATLKNLRRSESSEEDQNVVDDGDNDVGGGTVVEDICVNPLPTAPVTSQEDEED